jgi:hypothetical protein
MLLVEDDQIKKSIHRHANEYTKVLSELKDNGTEYKDDALNAPPINLPRSRFEARDYQLEAVASWEKSGYRGISSSPTGAGKTITGYNGFLNIGSNRNNITLQDLIIENVTTYGGTNGFPVALDVNGDGGISPCDISVINCTFNNTIYYCVFFLVPICVN